MINFIKKNKDYKLDVSVNNEMDIIDSTVQKYFNEMLKVQLTDFLAREKVTKRLFKYKSKIPVYIDSETLMMCIKSYRLEASFYINYFSIKNYLVFQNYIIMEFTSNHCLKLSEKYSFLNQIKRCKEIIEFLKL